LGEGRRACIRTIRLGKGPQRGLVRERRHQAAGPTRTHRIHLIPYLASPIRQRRSRTRLRRNCRGDRTEACVAAAGLAIAFVLAIVAFDGAEGSGTSSGKSSDEDQIRQVNRQYTQALNAADPERANALICKRIRAIHPATAEDLRQGLDLYGTYTTQVETIDISGDHADVRVTVKASKNSGSAWTMKIQYVREDGSWKRCSD
jgi:hypothetical protein